VFELQGTRVVPSLRSASTKMVAPGVVSLGDHWEKSVSSWKAAEVEAWLISVVRLPPRETKQVTALASTGEQLLALEFQSLQKVGCVCVFFFTKSYLFF
jgi:hypothetical protein